MKYYYLLSFLSIPFSLHAQKRPLDHSVYDNWQGIGERMISGDGRWVVYSINPQEGDNELIIQSSDAQYRKAIARGYSAKITEDNRFVIFKIKPFYKDTREARIKKKKQDEFPKDSLAILELGKDSIWKYPRVKSYGTPEKSFGWVAYQLEKPLPDTSAKGKKDGNIKTIDSLRKIIDSLQAENKMLHAQNNGKNRDEQDFADDESSNSAVNAPSDVILKRLPAGEEKIFKNALYYDFNKTGRELIVSIGKDPKDSMSKNYVLLYDLQKGTTDTLSKRGNDFKNFAMSEDGSQVAYLAERDSGVKALQKFYRIWYFHEGGDSAVLLCDRNSTGVPAGMTVSENGSLRFSKSGRRLFFGTADIQPPKDTTTADIDKVNVDIWNYKDDYLQTVQLNRLQTDLKKVYLAVYDFPSSSIHQLESVEIPTVFESNQGDGDTFVGVTDYGKRVESQWTGGTLKDIYAIDAKTGARKLVKKDLKGTITSQFVSPTGKYILWYDRRARNYFIYDGDTVRNLTSKIKAPLWDEENDVPDDPTPYDVMAWHEGDSSVYIYDRYGVWKVNVDGSNFLMIGDRKNKIVYRYVKTDPEERFISSAQKLIFRTFHENDKKSGLWEAYYLKDINKFGLLKPMRLDLDVNIGQPQKAKNAEAYIYTSETFLESPNLFVWRLASPNSWQGVRLSSINPQQSAYNWGTAELFHWTAYNGKESTGILYKPEDFDSKKKYPMICYFYETLSDGLNNYVPPSPTPSRLNISFFVSRGYVVFAPDIHYGTGHPGTDAYNYVVSGARALVKKGFVDSTRIGIQGQSWGGYQVAYLITATNLFRAAWAGAPVANMTSAYGGIRWESGLNRQFQYEKSQSRIGASLWEKPQLFIDNSPLFHLQQVKTPLVIMSNDADGAVPWYQGIELFTAMRRLGKQVWLLNYNGEAHNLVERKNRKDIQVREQQYFDWLLKGERPPKWITTGVPAVKKGRDWGLEVEK